MTGLRLGSRVRGRFYKGLLVFLLFERVGEAGGGRGGVGNPNFFEMCLVARDLRLMKA